MRPWVMLVIVCWGAASIASAQPVSSPRIEALTKKLVAKERDAEDAFWKQLAVEGTPIVEDIKDPKGRALITFVYRAKPATKAVAVYGTPNGEAVGYAKMSRLANSNVFAVSVLADPRARFMYWLAPGDDFGPPRDEADFQIRQPMWRPDTLNKTPYQVSASLVSLPKAPAQPWLVPKRNTPMGELTAYKVKSKALNNDRAILVYTPASYSPRGAKYPLVVMFDGNGAVNNLALPLVLDELIAAKQIPPCVVMLIGNTDRGRELSMNDAFADFVALDLVPWMRKTYHATNDPRLTVIAGISLGGLAASHLAARHPAVFGNVLSQSGAYGRGPKDVEPEVLARDYAKRTKLPLRFWIEAGMLEDGALRGEPSLLVTNRHFRDVLVARGYHVTYSEYVGPHIYPTWRGTLADGLIALLASPPKQRGTPPRSPGKPGGLEIGTSHKSILPIVQRTTLLDGAAATITKLKALGATSITEDELNTATYSLLELGHAKEAIPLFQWNVERFPTSSNVHDSLGEAHYLAGDRTKALASYKKALELDPKNENAKRMIELLSN
jgi:enterochelin esterase family protein